MEFVICDDDRLYASQFIEQLKVLESQYDELFNCVYYDHYENFMESLRNKECDKADIYFLDIEFGEVYGMDVAKIITRMKVLCTLRIMKNMQSRHLCADH